jgi:hypothetical protein
VTPAQLKHWVRVGRVTVWNLSTTMWLELKQRVANEPNAYVQTELDGRPAYYSVAQAIVFREERR